MKVIESALQRVDGYLVSLTRNPLNGWYEIQIGLPPKWEFGENKEIGCEIIQESEKGKLVKILPKNQNVCIDDLIAFVEIIISTNGKIAEKEQEFKDKMQEMKIILEKEAKKFYEELDVLKVDSFKTLNSNFVKTLHPENDKSDKSNKPRKSKANFISDTTTDNETQAIEVIKE